MGEPWLRQRDVLVTAVGINCNINASKASLKSEASGAM